MSPLDVALSLAVVQTIGAIALQVATMIMWADAMQGAQIPLSQRAEITAATAVTSFAFGLVFSFTYNVLAKFTGGVTVVLEVSRQQDTPA